MCIIAIGRQISTKYHERHRRAGNYAERETRKSSLREKFELIRSLCVCVVRSEMQIELKIN